MITKLNNRTDDFLKHTNIVVWSLVVVALFVYGVALSYNAQASVSTDTPQAFIKRVESVQSLPVQEARKSQATAHISKDRKKLITKRTESLDTSKLSFESSLSASPTHKRIVSIYSHLPRPKDLGLEFDRAAKKYNVSARLLLSMCVTESHLGVKKRNKSGATGICQIIPSQHGTTARAMLDYRQNIDMAARIVASYSQQCGGKWCAVQAYNVGINAYKKGVRARGYLAAVRQEYNKQIRSI